MAAISRFAGHHGPEIAVVIMIFVFMVVYFADEIFYTIPPGSVGVLWLRFCGGTVLYRYLGEGLHVIPPWDKIYIYDVRLQQLEQDFDVLSADGLKMTVNIAYRFQAIPDTVPGIAAICRPQLRLGLAHDGNRRACARRVLAQHTGGNFFRPANSNSDARF